MTAMAEGDRAAIFMLHGEFGSHMASFMRRQIRRLGIEQVSADDIDGLVIDACLELFALAPAWNPGGGALPWNWAGRRLAALASKFVGQHADELDCSRVDRRVDEQVRPFDSDAEELDVLAGLASCHDDCALVLEALERVAIPRDQGIVLYLGVQTSSGDPSPALTVAQHYGVSPDVVRQVKSRVRKRLRQLAETEARYAAVADLPLVA